MKARATERGAAHGIRPEIMSALYDLIIREACHIEGQIIDNVNREHETIKRRIATLGPSGSCHESATRSDVAHLNVADFEIILTNDFNEAAEMMIGGQIDLIVQGCAHPAVCDLLVRRYNEIFMVDTFIYPTKELALIARADVIEPKTLGLMPVTQQYIDTDDWPNVHYVCANPIVKRNFLEGKYDAAVTFTEVLTERPGEFQLIKLIGRTNMSWLVYSAARPGTEEIAVTSRAKELFINAQYSN